MSTRIAKVAVAVLAGFTLVGSLDQASARMNKYEHNMHTGYGYRHGHRGVGVGGAVALGVLGAAAAGVAANSYYNGYPAYRYGQGYDSPRYGYDYHEGHGYYGPY